MGLARRLPSALKPSSSTYFLSAGSSGGSGPTPACSGLSINGFRTTGSVGTLTPGTLKGYTITGLYNETSYLYEGEFNLCFIDATTLVFSVSGYTGSQTGLFTSIKYGNLTFNSSSVQSYSGGVWRWDNFAGSAPSGTIIIT